MQKESLALGWCCWLQWLVIDDGRTRCQKAKASSYWDQVQECWRYYSRPRLSLWAPLVEPKQGIGMLRLLIWERKVSQLHRNACLYRSSARLCSSSQLMRDQRDQLEPFISNLWYESKAAVSMASFKGLYNCQMCQSLAILYDLSGRCTCVRLIEDSTPPAAGRAGLHWQGCWLPYWRECNLWEEGCTSFQKQSTRPRTRLIGQCFDKTRNLIQPSSPDSRGRSCSWNACMRWTGQQWTVSFVYKKLDRILMAIRPVK